MVHITDIPESDPSDFNPDPLTQKTTSGHSISLSSAFLCMGFIHACFFHPPSRWPLAAPYWQTVLSAVISLLYSKIPDSILMALPWVLCSPWTSNCGPRIGISDGMEGKRMGNWTIWPESIGNVSVTKQEVDGGQRKTCFHDIILHLTGDETKA